MNPHESSDFAQKYPITSLFLTANKADPYIMLADGQKYIWPVLEKIKARYGMLISSQMALFRSAFSVLAPELGADGQTAIFLNLVCVGYELEDFDRLIEDNLLGHLTRSLIELGCIHPNALGQNMPTTLNVLTLVIQVGMLIKKLEIQENDSDSDPGDLSIWNDALGDL